MVTTLLSSCDWNALVSSLQVNSTNLNSPLPFLKTRDDLKKVFEEHFEALKATKSSDMREAV